MVERERADGVCPEPVESAEVGQPLVPGIFLSSVYRCESPVQAARALGGEESSYVYQRDGHPNADWLADKLRRLHGADWALLTSSGMAALAAVVMTELQAGDHLVVSRHLYGRSLHLLANRLPRWGVTVTVVDDLSADQLLAAVRPETRLLVVETITNPLLRVANIRSLAQSLQGTGVKLLVDNTLATPCVCRPLDHGADLVWESASKMINGHSDVMLGLVVGRGGDPLAYRQSVSTWGLASSPFDCWLTLRGVATLALRCERACANALKLAERLMEHPQVAQVHYPGLGTHPDRAVAASLFLNGQSGSVVTFDLAGGEDAADRLIRSSRRIPFCPSLGELSTTLSHPVSTSHRGLTPEERERVGISPGTIRLSVGTEGMDEIWEALVCGLNAAAPAQDGE